MSVEVEVEYKESNVSVDAGMRLQLLIRLRFSIPMQLHGDRVNHLHCVRNVSLENIREIEEQSEHTRPQCHSAQHKCSTTGKHKASVKVFSVPTITGSSRLLLTPNT